MPWILQLNFFLRMKSLKNKKLNSKQIRNYLENKIESCKGHRLELIEALKAIKFSIESAITFGGGKAQGNLIRSKKPINLIHEVIKSELVIAGVDSELIKPDPGITNGELKLSGFLKRKDQDISIIPENLKRNKETLQFEGILKNKIDIYGKNFTEQTLSINVRSQLSSFAKNFDTLYERTFAEAFNLHTRCPKMVLGELYMIAVQEYDSEAAKSKKVKFKTVTNIEKHIEKYLLAFDAINRRISHMGEFHKYERICLLIVDFNRQVPKVYSNDKELIKDKLLPQNSKSSIKNLSFETFLSELLKVYSSRF